MVVVCGAMVTVRLPCTTVAATTTDVSGRPFKKQETSKGGLRHVGCSLVARGLVLTAACFTIRTQVGQVVEV